MHWRHERLSVAMALADALHHSVQPCTAQGQAGGGRAVRRATAPDDSPRQGSGVLRVVRELRRVGWLPAAASRGGTAAGVHCEARHERPRCSDAAGD